MLIEINEVKNSTGIGLRGTIQFSSICLSDITKLEVNSGNSKVNDWIYLRNNNEQFDEIAENGPYVEDVLNLGALYFAPDKFSEGGDLKIFYY